MFYFTLKSVSVFVLKKFPNSEATTQRCCEETDILKILEVLQEKISVEAINCKIIGCNWTENNSNIDVFHWNSRFYKDIFFTKHFWIFE